VTFAHQNALHVMESVALVVTLDIIYQMENATYKSKIAKLM
jgi:hypothetical protein